MENENKQDFVDIEGTVDHTKEQKTVEPESIVVKKNWFERQADKAYEKRVKRAEKLQKAKEQPPKKTLKEKAKEAGPKILKGVAIVGGVGAAIVGGAIAYNAQRANAREESSNGIQDGVFYDLDTMAPVTEEEPAEIEVKTEEAQEA